MQQGAGCRDQQQGGRPPALAGWFSGVQRRRVAGAPVPVLQGKGGGELPVPCQRQGAAGWKGRGGGHAGTPVVEQREPSPPLACHCHCHCPPPSRVVQCVQAECRTTKSTTRAQWGLAVPPMENPSVRGGAPLQPHLPKRSLHRTATCPTGTAEAEASLPPAGGGPLAPGPPEASMVAPAQVMPPEASCRGSGTPGWGYRWAWVTQRWQPRRGRWTTVERQALSGCCGVEKEAVEGCHWCGQRRACATPLSWQDVAGARSRGSRSWLEPPQLDKTKQAGDLYLCRALVDGGACRPAMQRCTGQEARVARGPSDGSILTGA